jgi:hypothetical protein
MILLTENDCQTVPESIRDSFFKPGKAQSLPTFTIADYTRDETADIETKPWRLPPGPDIDAYFKTLTSHNHVFLLTADDLRRMGKDPALYTHIPDDWGYGDKRYLSRFDFTHQLHCLWMLKQLIHPEHYGHYNMSNAHDKNHMEHCSWALHQYLICHVTLDVYNYKWVDGMPRPFPEHSSQRQCRSMDELESFYQANDVSTDARIAYLVPRPGDYVHPVSAQHGAMQQFAIANEEAKLEGKTWLQDRQERWNQAVEEWRRTGVVPQTDISNL